MRPSSCLRMLPFMIVSGALLAGTGIGGAGGQPPEKKPNAKVDRPRLEFRIVVDVPDDWEVVKAAKKYFAAARTDPAPRERLQRRSSEGLPPEPFKLSGKGYTWVEIGSLELRNYGLDGTPGDRPAAQVGIGKLAAEARDRGEALPVVAGPNLHLVWSRARPEAKPPEGKVPGRFAYFVLVRDPEPGKAVTGKHLTAARVVEGPEAGSVEIEFELNKDGGDLMYELTSKNGGRSLAVVVDGVAIYTAVIMGPLRTKGFIKMRFSREEAEAIVAKLRADMSR